MVLLPVSPRPSPIRGALFATNPSISLLFPTVLRKERPNWTILPPIELLTVIYRPSRQRTFRSEDGYREIRLSIRRTAACGWSGLEHALPCKQQRGECSDR